MFTSDSRWDRHLPHQSYDEEPIEVGVIFKGGCIFPRWFIRNQKKYSIRQITYRWKDHRGGSILYFFAVTDGCNTYEIFFNTHLMSWRFSKVIDV